jgi:hypothetical protein
MHNNSMLINFLLNLAASLANVLSHKKGLEAKLSANIKALKEAETRLAAAESQAHRRGCCCGSKGC